MASAWITELLRVTPQLTVTGCELGTLRLWGSLFMTDQFVSSCVERHCRHSTNREVKEGVARIETADFPPQHVSFHIRCDLVFHSSQGSGEVKEKVREKSLRAKGPVLFGV